jgi:hypothetical protein
VLELGGGSSSKRAGKATFEYSSVGHAPDAIVLLHQQLLGLIDSRVVYSFAAEEVLDHEHTERGRVEHLITMPLMPGAMRKWSLEWRGW